MTTDRDIIDIAAKGMDITAEPFKSLAKRFDLSQEELIGRFKKMIRQGRIRRFAASVRHQPMGYHYNAMVLARTDEKNLDSVGNSVSEFKAVSHCYQRNHPDGDPWCIYIMVHGKDSENLNRVIEQIRSLQGVNSLEVCNSLIELKKTSLSGITTDLNK